MAGCLSALALAGCVGQAGSTPDGFTLATTSQISFAYPSGWRDFGTKGYPEGWKLVVERREGGEAVAQAAVFQGLPPKFTDPVLASEAVLAMMQLQRPDFRRLGDKAIDVPHATGARLVDFSYTAVDDQGEPTGTTVRGTDVVAVDDSGHAVVLRITREKGALDAGVLESIVDSVVLKTG